MRDILERKARAGVVLEIKRRWIERRDPGRIIRSPADLSDQELMALVEGKPEAGVRSIEDLSYEELDEALARIAKGDHARVH